LNTESKVTINNNYNSNVIAIIGDQQKQLEGTGSREDLQILNAGSETTDSKMNS